MTTDFSSLDKLVEFGLGVGIATQMMNTMNHVISQTAFPGTGINPGMTPVGTGAHIDTPFYIVHGERVAGPLNDVELRQLVDKGVIEATTFCWQPGMQGWRQAVDIPYMNKLLLLKS